MVGFKQLHPFTADVGIVEANEGEVSKLAALIDERFLEVTRHLLHHLNVLLAHRNAACLNQIAKSLFLLARSPSR